MTSSQRQRLTGSNLVEVPIFFRLFYAIIEIAFISARIMASLDVLFIGNFSLSDLNISPRGQADRLTIQEILHAAGVTTLDEPSDALNAKGKPFRRHGIVLHVAITYQNADSTFLGTGDITYSYHVRRIPYADYKVNQLIPVVSEKDFTSENTVHQENRVFRKRYGIKIEFHQSGKLGHFSLPALLLHLVSGVGLLTLTATIVDVLALYVLPDKLRYRRFVYEESPILELKKNE